MSHEMKISSAPALAGLTMAVLLLTGCGGSASAPSAEGANCTPDDELETVEDGVLKVAVVPVPNITDIENGDLVGLEGEILTGFAESVCLTVEPVEMSGQAIIPSVQNGLADVATGGWMDTEERRQVIAFSRSTYVDAMEIVSKAGYGSLEELMDAEASVGSPQGNWWVEDVQGLLGPALKVYQDFDETLLDVSAGRLDAAIVPSSSTLLFMGSDDAEGIESIPMAPTEHLLEGGDLSIPASFPLRKEAPQLAAALDAYIDEIDGNGTLNEIIETWGMPTQ